MKVENLYLELTRMCTLECEHCLRGDRRNEYMSFETINNVFKDISEIDAMLLTGGEPLLAIEQINKIIKIIKTNNIKVNRINLGTNGTVFNENILNVLKELSSIGYLDLKLSNDMFHYLEFCRLGLLEKREDNFEILKEELGAKNYADYRYASKIRKEVIYPCGKAANLTDKRLDEINIKGKTNYVINPYYVVTYNLDYDATDNKVFGAVNVDVNGNVVPFPNSFDSEDYYAECYESNVNNSSLLNCILNIINEKSITREENKDVKSLKKVQRN